MLLTATGGAVSGFAWLENDARARTLPSSEVWCLNGGGPSVAAHTLPEQSADATPDRQPCHPIVAAAVGGHCRAGCMRRRTGIEPASRAVRGSPVLKTGGATRHPDASGADVTRAWAAPAIRPAEHAPAR